MGPDKAALLGIVVLGLVSCFSPAGCRGQETSLIVVDSASKVTESASGDDLATLQNIFQDATAPQDGTIDPMRQIIADLGMKRMRILGADVYCDLDASGNFGNVPVDASGNSGAVVPGDCNLLAQQINWALSNHLAPHVALASSMPVSFVAYGPAERWSAATLARYKSYVSQLVSYVVRKSFDAGAPNGDCIPLLNFPRRRHPNTYPHPISD